MRTRPRIAASVVYRTVGIAALAAVLFVAGCSSSQSSPPQFGITTTSGQLVTGVVNSVYPGATLTAANGTGPYTWAMTPNPVDGLSLSTAGVVSGTPTTSGTFTVTVTVTDSTGKTATASLSFSVNPVLTSVAVTSPVTAGNTTSGTVTVSGPAPTAGAVVNLASSNTALATVPASVTVTATTSPFTAPFTVTTPSGSTGGQVTITATLGTEPSQTASLTVDHAPAITSANSTSFVVGAAGTFTVTATGTPAPTFTETGTLPSGVTLNPTTGALSGTPASGTQGSYPITITAANGIGTNATQNFTLNVDLAPTFTSGNSTTFTAGTAGTFTATATGFPAPTFSETGALPTGVTLTTAGVLSGTPAAGTGGTYGFTLTAANGVTPNATQSFTLTVDQAPAITSVNNATFTVSTLGSFTVVATGFPAPTLSETGTLPSGVSFTTAGVLSGTPASGTQGSYPITITAANGIGTNATQSFTLNVDLAPTFTSGNDTTFTTGTAGTFTATATGFPAPTFTETGGLPSGVTLTSAGILSGTPAAGTGGVYNITLTASNGIGTAATQSFTLTVDQAPAFTTANNATFTVSTLGSFTVVATGFPAPTLSETGTLPSGVSFTTAGVLSGTPASGTQGSYPITITAANGIGTNATQNFTLNVDLAPTFTSGNSTTFTAGTAGTFTATATGFPAPTFTETGALPSGVTLTTAGVLSGTPAAGTGGTYNITLTAANGATPNATQSFTLTVDQAPAITSQNSTTFAVGSLSSFTVTATGFPAPTFSETGTLPTGVSLSPAGVLSGTPASGTQSGSPYDITITASNGVGSNATQSFTLTVSFTAPPSFTSSNSATFTAGTLGTFTVTASGSPAPTFSVTAGTLPSGVTLNSTTGVLSGTPAANAGGTYPITITAQNTISPNATQSFTLTVDQAPAITSSSSTSFAVNTSGSFTVTTTGFPTPSLSEVGSLPGTVTFVDNGNGTATISGTPTATGSSPITITASNGIGTNATQSFTLTVTTGPPTVQISGFNTAPPIQVGATKTFTITVTNDVSGDLPTVTSFTLAGVACTPSTCGSFGAVTGTAGSGSYSMVYTPPTSLTAAISPTVTVSPSVAAPWFAGTVSFTVNPTGVVVTESGAINIVQPGSGTKTLTYTTYNDVDNEGVTLTLTASGYACQNLSLNSCGSLGTPSVTTSGTTTTTTVVYTAPDAVPAEPYDRPAIQATSVADTTKLVHTNFLIGGAAQTAPLSIPYGQKFDSALTGAAGVTVAAAFTDTSATKSATWQILANGTPCAAPTCGTLGTPVVTSNGNAVTSTVTYTPPTVVPTGTGQSNPTITATMNANSAATDSFTFSIVDGSCGTGKNSLLSGSYAFLVQGGSATGGYFTTVGSFTADGNGNITGGFMDRNTSTGPLVDLTLTGGSYSVGSDDRGCLSLTNSNGGTATYRIALGTISGTTATQGTLQTFVDTTGQGVRATGVLKQQSLTNVGATTFSGTYAFGREGMDSSGHRFAAAGLLTSNGAGALSGITLDIDDNGSFGTLSGGSGTYLLATNAASGRGTAQTTITGTTGLVTANYVAYVISSSDFFVMSTDPTDANHPIISGENKLQTGPFSTSMLTSGSGYVFYASGIDPSNGGSTTTLGQSQFTSSSGNATVTVDENDNGISQTEQTGAATFTVASSGRMTGTGVGVGSNPPIFYWVDSTQSFFVGTDSAVSAGYVEKQTVSSFSTSTITGQFFFGGGAPTDGGSYDTGTVTFTPGSPTGTISGTDDESGPNYTLGCVENCGGGGLQPNNPISGNGGSSSTYTFGSGTAPGQGNVGGGSLAYIVSPSKLIFIQEGTAENPNPAEVFIIQQ